MNLSRQSSSRASQVRPQGAADYSTSESEDETEYVLPGINANDFEYRTQHPRKRRRVDPNSKEKAALGVFGSDSDDDRGPHQQWKSKTLRDRRMNFVSTAALGTTQDEEHSETGEKATDDIRNGSSDSAEDDGGDDVQGDEEMNDLRPVGLVFSKDAEPQYSEMAGSIRAILSSTPDSQNMFGHGFVPSSAKVPILKVSDQGEARQGRGKPQASAFGPRGTIRESSFGARMMAKMGYVKGTGLGKEGQGRNLIIEANLRPQGVGLGAVKEKTEQERREEKRQAKLRGEQIMNSDEEVSERKKYGKLRTNRSSTKHGSLPLPQRKSRKYLTAEILKASVPGLRIPEAFSPILDMTGREKVLHGSMSGALTPSSVFQSKESLERDKIASKAQGDLLAFSNEWQCLKAMKSNVEGDLKVCARDIELLQADLQRLRAVHKLIIEGMTPDSDLETISSCLSEASKFSSVNTILADIAVAAIATSFKRSTWDPCAEVDHIASAIRVLSVLLKPRSVTVVASERARLSAQGRGPRYGRRLHSSTAYETMIFKLWLPRISKVMQSWDALTPAPMLTIIETWTELLPAFVQGQVMESIARKLDQALSDWQPRRKHHGLHLPHIWLFPWLQYLPSHHLDPKGTGLVADVRRKFRQLIDAWDFRGGVIPGLQEWQDVFGEQWRSLVMAHILPAMGKFLRQNFEVDPSDQEPYLPALLGVMKWHQLLGGTLMCAVLVHDVFPKWLAKLNDWLSLEEVDLAEIADWYTWWRGSMLQEFADYEDVNVELDKGLQLLTRW